MRLRLRSVLWALSAMTVGFLGARFIVMPPSPPGREPLLPTAATVEPVQLAFSSLEGGTASLGQWKGEVVLLNFWASWCAPCREEMPLFQRLREQYRVRGFEVVGVAVEDQPEKVRAFRQDQGITYPLLMAGTDAPQLMRQLGNTMAVLPFSLLLDRQGRIAHSKIGVLTQKELESWIAQKLN